MRPTFVRIWREASELKTHAQRVASALDVYSAHAERITRAHVKKIQLMHSVLLVRGKNEWPAHASLDMRLKHAGCALGVRYVCDRCSLDLNRRIYNEYPACAPRVPGVGPMYSAHVWCPSGVFIYASCY